jgi:biopolymer transport protein ExbB/TolQ
MRPYLAILYDAFLEAIQSRVLWVLLAAWVLLLAAIAPFGFIEEKSYQLRSGDILQRSQLLEQLQQAARGKGKPTQQAVVASLPESARKLLAEQSEDDAKRFSSGRLSDWLNEAARSRRFSSRVEADHREGSQAPFRRRNSAAQSPSPGMVVPRTTGSSFLQPGLGWIRWFEGG